MLFTVRWSTMPDVNTPRKTDSTHEMLSAICGIMLLSSVCTMYVIQGLQKNTRSIKSNYKNIFFLATLSVIKY